MRNFSRSIALCSSLLLPAACTKSSPEKDADTEKNAPNAAAARAMGSGLNILVAQDLAKLYPADAIAVGAIAGPERFFEVFGRDEIVTKLGPLYVEATDEIREATGQDLLSASGLAAFGVDPSQPIGMFYWRLDDESGGAFVGLSDREKFLSSVRALAARGEQALETHEHAGATILCPKGETDVCLIVTATHAYVAGSAAGADAGLRIAKQLAELSKDKSMATNEAFHAATAKLERGADMAGYLNLAPIIELAMGKLGKQTTARDKGQAALVREILGPLRSVVMAGDFDARAFSGQAFIHTQGSSLLAKLARNGTRVNPVIHAMGEDAALLGAYNLDPLAVFGLVKMIAAAEGEDLDESLAQVKAMTGFDVEKDLLAAISGEFGLGFQAQMDQVMASMMAPGENAEAELIAAVDGAITIGFTDAAKGKALVERAFGTAPLFSFVTRDDAKDLWRAPTPIGKTMLFSLATPADGSAYLVVASNEALLASVKNGAAAPAFSGQASNEAYATFIGDADAAVMYSARYSMLGMGAWMGLSVMDYPDVVEAVDPNATAEHRKKAEELQQVRKQLAEVRQAERDATSAQMRELFEPWGVTAASMTVAPDGWDLRVGQFIDAPSWAALANGLVESGMKMRNQSRDQSALQEELYAKESALQAEIAAMQMLIEPAAANR